MGLPVDQSDLTRNKSHQAVLACTYILYFVPSRTTPDDSVKPHPFFPDFIAIEQQGISLSEQESQGTCK